MALDPRSKERLEALGRSLPQKLPQPDAGTSTTRVAGRTAAARGGEARGAEARHPLERAQDPAELFRALISASADGSVPPHLLDQLRDLEAVPRGAAEPAAPGARAPGAQAPGARPAGLGPKRAGGSPQRQGGGGGGRGGGQAGRSKGQSEQDQALYTAFAQLLLEDEGAAD